MDEKTNSVDPKQAVAGLATLGALLVGLAGSIVYRIAVEDRSQPPLPPAPSIVLDPNRDPATIASGDKPAKAAHVGQFGGSPAASQKIATGTNSSAEPSPAANVYADAENAEVLAGYEVEATTSAANGIANKRLETNGRPTAPDGANPRPDRARSPYFVAPAPR